MEKISLMQLKQELRDEIRSLVDSMDTLKHEQDGVDRVSGHYAQTGRFQMKLQVESQLEMTRSFLKRLYQVDRYK